MIYQWKFLYVRDGLLTWISYPGFPSDDRRMCIGMDDMTAMHLQVSISLRLSYILERGISSMSNFLSKAHRRAVVESEQARRMSIGLKQYKAPDGRI